MCTQVLVIKGEKNIFCETVEELADALGVSAADVSNDPPENCLCGAFFEKLGAKQTGIDEGFPFPEFIIHAH